MKEGSNEGLVRIFDCCKGQLPGGVQPGMVLERVVVGDARANLD